ncbi:hypothetical protein [Sporosarcina sp. G11-34]|uniref:hypothetical protein n=1 Tax=Sporosarcina sp. G11-34 TaxID=2849605 RepID=UPI0022A94363|nr:hypothetical protein [Sporosarcina sp. G11-34]MCZ2257231.1 hypothetical protein [Sporosarcina sp. G11-34]
MAPEIYIEKPGVFLAETSPAKKGHGNLKQTKILIADDEHVNLQVLLISLIISIKERVIPSISFFTNCLHTSTFIIEPQKKEADPRFILGRFQ